MENFIKNYKEYYRHFKNLIELEREEQIRFHLNEIKKLPGWKRELLGRAILGLRGKFMGKGLGGLYIVKFSRDKEIGETEISPGDVVIVSKGKPSGKEPQGTVIERGKRFLTVGFEKKPPDYVFGKNLRIDLFVNDITFKRMEEALRELNRHTKILNILLGNGEVIFENIGQVGFINDKLNHSQKEAVVKCLSARDFFLIHGPPGTGKTTTLVECILQLVRMGKKVLATADSNVAVDNIVERLRDFNIKVVRVGNPARISKSLITSSLFYILESDKRYKKIREIWEEIDKLKAKQERFLKPTPRWRRGMSDEEILRYAETGSWIRGVNPKAIKSMASWIKLQEKINDLYQEAKNLEDKLIKDILINADVVCSTNSMAGSEYVKGLSFDVVVVDEATQSVEPSTLIPIIKGKKFILAGDHKQLPPTVLNPKAEKYLQITLFERLVKMYKECYTTLRVQYRMNKKIMEFPSRMFYNNLLIADEKVKNHTLKDFGINGEGIFSSERVVVFIDTKGKGRERQRKGSTSYENPLEAKICSWIAKEFIKMGLKPEHIGVISPYDDQVSLLTDMLKDTGVEVKTVDGFQGREKEVIIVSFVRSNPEGNLGFLEDLRRLNVSITRAKRKLVLIGDSLTLSNNEVYYRLIHYVCLNGLYLLKI